MEHTDSFDTRDPFRPSPLLAALAALLLLCATHVRADEAPNDAVVSDASLAEPAPPPAPPQPVVTSDEQDSGLGHKIKNKVDSVLNDDGKDGSGAGVHWGPLYPSFAVVSTGASIAPMLQFWKSDIGGSGLDVHAAAAYSILKYQYYSARVGWLPQRSSGPPSFVTSSDKIYPLADLEKLSGVQNRFELYGGARYRDYPREDFYGLGPASFVDDRTDYRLKDHLFEVVTAFHFSPRVALLARAGWLGTTLATGQDDLQPDLTSRFDDQSAPGMGNPPDMLVFTGGFLTDLRDVPGNPHRGALLLVGVSRFNDRNADAFAFNRLSGDLRVYAPLGSKRHVIAARALASVDDPDTGNRVPFYLQSSLGGSQLLRGYPGFRFRDLNVMAFSAEYRFEAFWKIELAAFYDIGQLASERHDLGFSHLRATYGAGIRLKSPSKVLLRVDVAHGREGTHAILKLGPSF